MNIQLKFEIGQTVYRIKDRAAQVGTVESYTIRINDVLSNQYKEKYVVKYGTTYPTRVEYLNTELDQLYETKEECEKAILQKYFGHLLKEGAIK